MIRAYTSIGICCLLLFPLAHANGQTTTTQNHTVATQVLVGNQMTAAQVDALPLNQRQRQVTYYDGLGRPLQMVDVQASPLGRDVVTPVAYDGLGRAPLTYLPYAISGGGGYQANAITQQQAFYQTTGGKVATDPVPRAVAEYEPAPLNRIIRQGAPGTAWQPDGTVAWSSQDHTVKTQWRTNQTGEVRLWACTARKVVSAVGHYAAGELRVTETKDENGHLSVTYQDKQGKVVQRKIQEAATVNTIELAGFLVTQYVYDDYGRLRVVIQPEGTRQLPTPAGNGQVAPTFVDAWCFRYEYDIRGRVVEKQVPGAGAVEIVYNNRDQIILQRGHAPLPAETWTFTKYDGLGRAVLTGLVPMGSGGAPLTREQAQTLADASTLTGWERPDYTSPVGYTLTNSFPAAVSSPSVAPLTADHVTAVTYYDSYRFQALTARPFVAETGVGVTSSSASVHGLVTGNMERVIGAVNGMPGPWLTTAVYYDDEHRVVQTRRDLYPSGWERTTLELDFAGRVRQSLVRHNFPLHVISPEHTLRQTFDYDQASRLTETRQQIDGQPEVIVARQVYNELGQLVDKKLHSTDRGGNFLQSVDYRHNIRGWLANINNRNISNETNRYNSVDPNVDNEGGSIEQPDLFGMEIMYNANQNLPTSAPQYNGNVSKVMWRTKNPATGTTLRGYSYHYDPANRINRADYRTYEGTGSWSIYGGRDYSVSGISYDANGNLLTMTRKGVFTAPGKLPQYGTIDKLSYKYSVTAGVTTEGNRLIAVDDMRQTLATHDFEDQAGPYTPGSAPEYSYDAVGNLTSDRNKNIREITYNHLNLMQQVVFEDFEAPTISYLYTASGAKVAKVAGAQDIYEEYTGTSTYYAGGYMYEQPVGRHNTPTAPVALRFAHMPEGRLLYSPIVEADSYHWKYEYHLKDHLGNLRFAFRAEGSETQQIAAGMEQANAAREEEQFEHVAETRFQDALHARTGTYVAKLNAREGRRLGPSVSWPVQAGDSVRAEVYGRYDHQGAAGRFLRRGALVTGAAAGGAGDQQVDKQQAFPGRRRWLPFVGGSLVLVPQLFKPRQDELPQAFLRYELFDQDSQLVATRVQPLQRTTTDEWQHLEAGLKADSAGYVRVLVVNESGIAAYFDDLALRTVAAQVQENHYDPWGLNLVGIEDAGEPDHKFQYNGKEKQEDFGLNWLDYGTRMYDSQLGRWHAIDPLSDQMSRHSPYNYAFDNPMRFIDPDGMRPTSTHTDAQGRVLAVYNDGDLGVYRHKTANTTSQIDKLHSKRNTSAGGERMGETMYWDDFLATHPGRDGIRRPTNSAGALTYQIKFGDSWDQVIKDKSSQARGMQFTPWRVAEESANGGDFSLQDQPELTAQGRLFKGKYFSTESMGNYLAGYNAAQTGLLEYDGFQRMAGALELRDHGHSEIQLDKTDKIMLGLGIKHYGTPPLYGEVIQQYRMSRMGWNDYHRDHKSSGIRLNSY